MSEETNGENGQANPRNGHITDMGMLDFTSAKSAADFSGIKSIKDVGLILVPEHLAAVLLGIEMADIGAVVPVPTGEHVTIITGQTRMTGESLAAGDPETVLVIVGQVMVTTPVQNFGYKALLVIGQVFAPRGSETALGSKIKQVTGQLTYYPEGARIFMGEDTVSREFLEMLTQPTAFVIMGQFTFASDVDVELLRTKVSDIVLMGEVIVPPGLLAIVQFLTTEKMGVIKVQE